MVVLVRLDLDKFDLGKLSDLVRDGIISVSEATEARAFRELSAYEQLLQSRFWAKSVEVKAAD